MKQNLKRILPVLLAVLIIVSAVWYLFVYDRDFARDMLVKQARFFERQGKQSLAVWLYDRAYNLSGADENVAIELAEQFISIGDYTKAERTLSKAIADSGSANLYIALSKTYVQQDKLKDAVAMLDNITNPEIKAQLEALRPTAPTVNPAPGFYSQYVPVTVECQTGTLYVTVDSGYPSTANAPHSGEITLHGGENTIRALCVGENGLVSPLAVFGYTVKGVIEPVTLTDSSLETLLREQLGIGKDSTLYTSDLWNITQLKIPETVQSGSDLAYLTSLQKLEIANSTVSGWDAIANLEELKELTIRDSLISARDLLAIASAPKLEKLTISRCNLSNITNLSNAKKLTYLDLSGNNGIRDLTALSFMTGLNHLDLNHNALENLSAISSLVNLEYLNVSNNSLSSVVPLGACTALKELNISYNKTLSALTGCEAMTGLTKLNASYCAVTDISAVSACSALTELDISNNALTDISTLAGITSLQYVNFSHNQVSALPKWPESCGLITIDGSYNKISSLSSLAGYRNLNEIIMDYNNITSVKALNTCPKLISVSVFSSKKVTDGESLKDHGIIVNYKP